MEEISRYRKREHQLKTQLMGDSSKVSGKTTMVFDSSDVTSLLVNLDVKRNNLIKDIGDRVDGRRLTGATNMTSRRLVK